MPSGEEALSKAFGSSDYAHHMVQKNYPYTGRLVGGALTTVGTQWSALTSASTLNTSAAMATILSSTISWPGLDGQEIDEAEFGLTAELYSAAATSKTTVGFLWQIKNKDETTWTGICTDRQVQSTIAVARTMSGYRLRGDGTLAAGYNTLPLNIRLQAYTRTGSKNVGLFRVKNSSYVRIKVRRP